MIGVDTNILVYAHRRDSAFHGPAADRLRWLCEGSVPWVLPWPCLYEFWNIATHPRIFRSPSSPAQARDQIRAWIHAPTCHLIGELPATVDDLDRLVDGEIRGPRVHDARIALICHAHGVEELWSADRDFSRFPWLRTINPLV